MAKGIFIGSDKTLRVQDFDYSALSAAVEGLIEPIELSDGSTMYVNEEYLYTFGADRFNSIAGDVCGLGGQPHFMLRQPILGNVVVVGPLDDEGDDTDVTDAARGWIVRVAREAGSSAEDVAAVRSA